MHLAYFYDHALPSQFAAPIQYLRTARALAEHGVGVDVCVREIANSDEAACLSYYGLSPHERLRLVPFYANAHNAKERREALKKYLDQAPPGTVVMSRGEPAVALSTTLNELNRKAAGSTPARFIYEVHRPAYEELIAGRGFVGLFKRLQFSRFRSAEALTVKSADRVVCLTEGVRSSLASAFELDESRSIILPSGVELASDGLDQTEELVRDIDILYVGKVEARKGVDLLIRALADLAGYNACIVGGNKSNHQWLLELARKHGIDDRRLQLPGYVRPDTIRQYYQRARVGVCPLPQGVSAISDRYTSPMKLLEMMANRLPIVASNLPTIKSIVRDEDSALLVPPNDPAALATAIARLHDDSELAAHITDRAYEAAAAYSWDQRALKLKSLLESLG